jgi:hypothetical protein
MGRSDFIGLPERKYGLTARTRNGLRASNVQIKDFSPNGQPYLFLLADTIQCFVPPKGGL